VAPALRAQPCCNRSAAWDHGRCPRGARLAPDPAAGAAAGRLACVDTQWADGDGGVYPGLALAGGGDYAAPPYGTLRADPALPPWPLAAGWGGAAPYPDRTGHRAAPFTERDLGAGGPGGPADDWWEPGGPEAGWGGWDDGGGWEPGGAGEGPAAEGHRGGGAPGGWPAGDWVPPPPPPPLAADVYAPERGRPTPDPLPESLGSLMDAGPGTLGAP
jgi:hypothetical protein